MKKQLLEKDSAYAAERRLKIINNCRHLNHLQKKYHIQADRLPSKTGLNSETVKS